MKLKTIITMLLAVMSAAASAQTNEQQAREVVLKALDILQNPGGASLNYKIDVSFFHRQGYVVFKGRKFQRRTKRVIDWFDGTTYWTLNRQANTVRISVPKRNKQDEEDENAGLTAQMNAVRDNCRFQMTSEGANWKVVVKTDDRKAKIRHAEMWINKKTYKPSKVRFKVGLIWANITVWNVKADNYSDVNFYFHPDKYPNVKIIDKRK